MELPLTRSVSKQCAQGLHGFCQDTASTCACDHCHLGPCTTCGDDNLRKLYGNGECWRCYRRRAKAEQASYTEPCDKCGTPGAFRNPVHRRNEYLCASCHGASGEAVVLTSSVAHLVAPCKGSDVSSDLHTWVHIRGSRFQCICGEKKYDAVLRAERSKALRLELFHDTES